MDRQLLEQLYRAYYRELYLYIFSFCKNPALAEDLLQETFLKAILSLPDSHTNMRAWLYRVARNLSINAMKKASPPAAAEEIEDTPDPDGDPLANILQKEQYRTLYQALQNLSKIRREILIMQYFGGLSHKEIAAVLQTTPGNVRVAAARARAEMKKYMEGEK